MRPLGDFFRARRVEQGFSLGQLARMLGYRNLSRGSNRIKTFEGGGKVAPELLAKLASALAISDDEVRRLAAEDYREWLRWADEPVRPYLVIRHMACVYERVALPDDALDPGTAEAFAARLARERKRRVCLVTSRRLSVGFDATGMMGSRLEATPDMPCEPYAVIGGRRCQFDFRGGMVLHPIDEPR